MSQEKRLFSDEELVAGIRSGGSSRERCMNFLLRHWEFLIPEMCKRHNIREEDAEELYLDAAFVLYEHIKSGQFREQSKLSTYLYRIYFNKCVDLVRKNSADKTFVLEKIPEPEDQSGNILKQLIFKEDFDRAMALMNQLGNFCKELLLDSLYRNYTLDEVAKRNKLKDAAQVSNRKYKCLQKLKGISEK